MVTVTKILYLSIGLESTMVCLQAMNLVVAMTPRNQHWIRGLDIAFLVIAALYLLASIFFFVYFRMGCFGQKACLVRKFQGLILVAVGVIVLSSAWSTAGSLRIYLGVASLGDGCIYFFIRPSDKPSSRSHSSNVRQVAGNDNDPSPPVYIIPALSNELPAYEPPPSYFEVTNSATPNESNTQKV